MKRSVIIALLLLAVGALVLVPFLKDNAGDEETADVIHFNFDENLLIPLGKAAPIPFTVDGKQVRKVELIYNDSVFQTWTAPNGKITYTLQTDYYGVGARNLVLRAYLKSGGFTDENHLIRVVSDIVPKEVNATVVASYPHNTGSYTQGLEFSDGVLYEGTGDPGQQGKTILAKVNLNTGAFIAQKGLDATYFGEGITIMGNKIYQLTWQSGKCFVYDKKDLNMQLKEFSYTGEGWGLCNDGKQLIMSDGSERITFRDPNTFSIIRTMEVYDNLGPRVNLNELEYIDGKIYANVYTSDFILVIDPVSGKVLEEIDASALAATGKMGGEVLNGIAWNPAAKKLYMTGKYWGKILEVKLSQ